MEESIAARVKKHKRMQDRFTLLPDFILHHILSFLLDDPKSRLRMSVLSKAWFTLTSSCPILYFDQRWQWCCSFSRKYGQEYINQKFYEYVEYTVSKFCDQNISAHTLHIFAHITNLEQIQLLGRCLDLLLEKGLQVMDIHFRYDSRNMQLLRLPNTLLSASSLTSLTLSKCELPLSSMVVAVKFKSLKLLSLSNLPIDDGAIEYLTKGSPLLEKIDLGYCYGFKMFCVKRHENLLKVVISCDIKTQLERIDVEAPNLSYFLLESDQRIDKAPTMFLGSCKKLTTFCYSGSPLERFSDLLSNFPILENVALDLPSHVNNLKLSSNSLRKLRLRPACDLNVIDLNAPKILLFEYGAQTDFYDFAPLSREDSSLTKGCMKCQKEKSFNSLWYQKLRRFLDNNGMFKVLKLVIYREVKDGEKLKAIQSPPHELEHLELIIHTRFRIHEVSVYATVLDAVLWCCRPRSLTLQVDQFAATADVVKYTYEKLLEQEVEGQTNISFSKDKQHFRDLNSLLKAPSLDQSSYGITFIKERAVQEAG